MGYTFINFIVNEAGMNYAEFKLIFYAVGYGIIFFVIYKNKSYSNARLKMWIIIIHYNDNNLCEY